MDPKSETARTRAELRSWLRELAAVLAEIGECEGNDSDADQRAD